MRSRDALPFSERITNIPALSVVTPLLQEMPPRLFGHRVGYRGRSPTSLPELRAR